MPFLLIVDPRKHINKSLAMAAKDTRPDGNYNVEQLAMGIRVESEHTDDPEIAKKIAKDHLDEIPDYYDRLEKMEDEAMEKGWSETDIEKGHVKAHFRIDKKTGKKVFVKEHSDARTKHVHEQQPDKPLNEFKPVDIKSKEFKEWFGDSKVVDKDGKPLVVYHGSRKGGFDKFKIPSWFTTDDAEASRYARDDDGAQVLPLHLSITNPYHATSTEILNAAPSFIASLINKGYDGMVFVSEKNPLLKLSKDKQWFLPFNDTQIKSALSNTGKFSKTDPDIRKSLFVIDLEKGHVKAHFRLDQRTGKRVFIKDFDNNKHQHLVHASFHAGDTVKVTNPKSKHFGKEFTVKSYNDKYNTIYVSIPGQKHSGDFRPEHLESVSSKSEVEPVNQDNKPQSNVTQGVRLSKPKDVSKKVKDKKSFHTMRKSINIKT